jgi:hypothetical protein
MVIMTASIPGQDFGVFVQTIAMRRTATKHRMHGEGDECQQADGKKHAKPNLPKHVVEVQFFQSDAYYGICDLATSSVSGSILRRVLNNSSCPSLETSNHS